MSQELARFIHYKTHIQFMDDDHHHLIVLMNEIVWDLKNNRCTDRLKLDNLLAQLRLHFKTEECFMDGINYPFIADHKLEHSIILTRYYDTINQLNGCFNVLVFIEMLEDIIIRHIDFYDLRIADFYWMNNETPRPL